MITLREHERIKVAETWDTANRSLGKKELDMLLWHQEQTGKVLLEPGFRCVKATSWVGTLGLGDHCLDVLPKIDDSGGTLNARQTRKNLLWMVARAGIIPIADADIATLAQSPQSLLAAFLQLYVDKLSLEWQRGPIRQYVSAEGNRTFLRGKLLFAEQLRQNLIQQHRFFTRTDEFTMDNRLSALLKAALRRCAAQPLSAEAARSAKRLLLEFDEVSDFEFSRQQADEVQVTRQHERYSLLVRLARMILQTCSPGRSGQGAPIYSLMFDMNMVFEGFVAAELKIALAGSGLTVRAQLKGRSLVNQHGKARFRLKPDIGVYHGSELVCLIDTKWKRLDPNQAHHGVSQADMYQMYAYGKEFDSPRTLLLYPQSGKLPAVVAEYRHNAQPMEEGKQIQVMTLPITTIDGSLKASMDLRARLVKLVTPIEKFQIA